MPKSKVSKKKTGDLIELVRDHSLLYNPSVPEHKDVQLTFNIKRSIAEILAVGKFSGKYKVMPPCMLYITIFLL